jgi:hypothetical protein
MPARPRSAGRLPWPGLVSAADRPETPEARRFCIYGRTAVSSTDADLRNLFPRLFRVVTAGYTYTVHLWWWKFASPVRDGDTITIRGSRSDLLGHDVIRVSSFTSHWLQIHNP